MHATTRHLHDLFVTACEGGIEYWCDLIEYRWALDDRQTDDLDGFYAIVADIEDGKRYRIDAATLDAALPLCAQSEPNDTAWPGADASVAVFEMLVAGARDDADMEIDLDANAADCIVQIALLGEVRYS